MISLQLCSLLLAIPQARGKNEGLPGEGRNEAVLERSSLSRVAGHGVVNGACP